MSDTIIIKKMWLGLCQNRHSDKAYLVIETPEDIQTYYGPSNRPTRRGRIFPLSPLEDMDWPIEVQTLINKKIKKGYVEVSELGKLKYFAHVAFGNDYQWAIDEAPIASQGRKTSRFSAEQITKMRETVMAHDAFFEL